jgi:glucosyl-3-phosphoglycerate synthase
MSRGEGPAARDRPFRARGRDGRRVNATRGCFTFAVVGHNEAPTLAGVLEQACAAAEDGDRVWFVDSASSDESAAIAARLGVEVVSAPLGKGQAIATALERVDRGSVCYIDADVQDSAHNIPGLLRRAAAASDAEMIVGQVDRGTKRGSTTIGFYRPLVGALFPEAREPAMIKPLSGFRVLRAEVDYGDLPDDYGVETYLNIAVALAGGRTELCPLGAHRGPLRYHQHAAIGAQVATTVLDLAQAHGRLDPGRRHEWEAWLEPVLELLQDQPPAGQDDGELMAQLHGLAQRPLPAAHADIDGSNTRHGEPWRGRPAEAPVTGSLGVESPHLPRGSRFGRRVGEG